MKRIISALMLGGFILSGCATANSKTDTQAEAGTEIADTSVVYMTREISPEAILKLYKALGREARGKVAVKISTGEPGGHNFLDPKLIAPFVKEVDGTIVECNTAYQGKRFNTEDHRRAAEEHGFTAIAPVDIMDADGEVKLPSKAASTSNTTSWARTTSTTTSPSSCRISRDMPWADSEARSRICP